MTTTPVIIVVAEHVQTEVFLIQFMGVKVIKKIMKHRTIAIIQARMSSTRLPGKVLRDIAGEPMLARVIERAKRAKLVDEVVLATTTDPSDDPVAEFCAERGYNFTRGSLNDVLDRYYQAAKEYKAEVIVRLTADCPVLDPDVVDQTIQVLGISNQESGVTDEMPFDFVANRLPPRWDVLSRLAWIPKFAPSSLSNEHGKKPIKNTSVNMSCPISTKTPL